MSSGQSAKTYVTFWGTRGSISTPGRNTEKYGGNTPCVSVQHRDAHIIFDAGTGIRNLGIELIETAAANSDPMSLHLFLSHTHWDHIQGLPFFQPAYYNGTKLIIYGSPKKERFLEAVLRGQMDNEYFPVEMSAFAADLSIREVSEETIRIGDLTVDWQEQNFHPGGSVRYRVTVDGKKIVYATDVELNSIFDAKVENDELLTMGEEYLEFVDTADLLIADGQYTDEEYQKYRGWGHTSIPLLLEIAQRAKVKQLAIFHHDPKHSDKTLDEFWREQSSHFLSGDPQINIFWSREGVTLPI